MAPPQQEEGRPLLPGALLAFSSDAPQRGARRRGARAGGRGLTPASFPDAHPQGPLQGEQQAAAVRDFVAAASKAIEDEDVIALQRAIEKAEALGLKTKREQEALGELRRKLAKRVLRRDQLKDKLRAAQEAADPDRVRAAIAAIRSAGLAKCAKSREKRRVVSPVCCVLPPWRVGREAARSRFFTSLNLGAAGSFGRR